MAHLVRNCHAAKESGISILIEYLMSLQVDADDGDKVIAEISGQRWYDPGGDDGDMIQH